MAQRANLYKTIERLQQAGLITVSHTERDQRFPERTVYQITDQGLRLAREWLVAMLSQPRNEFPQFPAALSFIFGLTPDEALSVLETRAAVLRDNLARYERNLTFDAGPPPPRVTLLDGDYLRLITEAELNWVNGVIEELRSGVLTWSYEELAEAAKSFL